MRRRVKPKAVNLAIAELAMPGATIDGAAKKFRPAMRGWFLAGFALIFGGWPCPLPARAFELAVGDIVLIDDFNWRLLQIDPVTGIRTPLTGHYVRARSVLVEPAGTVIVGNARLNGDWSSFMRIDPRDQSMMHALPVPVLADPWRMALDSSGRLLFGSLGVPSIMAADFDTGEVSVVATGEHLSDTSRFALEPSGSIVAISGVWAPPGVILRINPETGEQSIVSTGGLLVDLSDVAVTTDGSIYVASRISNQGCIVRVDPETGAQSIVSAGGLIGRAHYDTTVAVAPDDSLVIWAFGVGPDSGHGLVRVDPATGAQVLITAFEALIVPDFVGLTVVPSYSCPPAPVEGCTQASRSKLTIKASTDARAGTLVWTWARGTAAVADFGAPETATKYSLCAYLDGSNILNAPIAVGGTCAGRPCWRRVRASGFEYRNRDGSEYGMSNLRLRAGAGSARIKAIGAGNAMPLPDLPLPLTDGLRVQLIRTGGTTCWESDYPTVRRNSARLLQARSGR